MASTDTPSVKLTSRKAISGSGSESRDHLAVLIGVITSLLSGILSIALVYYSVNHPSSQNFILAGTQTAAWLIAFVSLLRLIKNTSTRVYLLISSILMMMAGYSILVSGQAITSALVALIYTILITSVSVSGNAAERGLMLGGAGAWLISLCNGRNQCKEQCKHARWAKCCHAIQSGEQQTQVYKPGKANSAQT